MSPAGVLHAIPVIAFVRFVTVAMAVFRDPDGARRTGRGSVIGLSFWAVLASTVRAPLAPVPLVILGLLLQAVALGLFEWAVRSIRGRSFSLAGCDDVPTFVHADGPYAYIRNPFYTSYLLSTWAAVCIWPTPAGLLVAAAMVVYYNWLAAFEERKFDTSAVRAEYQRYKPSAGRLLPRFGRNASASPSRAER